jgi:OOP family OmpA-OmpF porin
VVAPAAAAGEKPECKKICKKKCEAAINDIIYDLTIPWPFRHRGAPCAPADSDGDGVLDDMDKCPDTPKGARVDENGCPTDSDGDGVYDGIDKCPDTPAKVKVDSQGCPKDSDGDGVFDGIDDCADTPKGATVDARGCPSDADSDGVYDGIDLCPNTPSDLAVDKNGCPIEISETETQLLDTGMISSSNILFETGKADLKPKSHGVLDEIGRTLVQWPELEIEISGHTDSRGSAEFNQKLSEKRSQSVKDYLVDKFDKVDGDNLSVVGYGESKPIASNDTKAGRAKNRRVEFTVLNKETLKREIERRRSKKK